MLAAAYCESLERQPGLGHPPWEGGGSPRANRSAKEGLGGSLEGSERPEAG